MEEEREARRAARAAKEAEIRARLEADIRTSTDFIYGVGTRNAHNQPARVPFAAAREAREEAMVRRAAMAAAGMNGMPVQRDARRGAFAARGAGGARGRGGNRLVEAGEEDMFVACPHCFRPVFGSAMANHLLTQCSGDRSASSAGHGEEPEAVTRPLYTDPVRAQQDLEYAEALAADQAKDRLAGTTGAAAPRPPRAPDPAPEAVEDSTPAEAEAEKREQRDAMAAAAMRRMQLAQEAQAGADEVHLGAAEGTPDGGREKGIAEDRGSGEEEAVHVSLADAVADADAAGTGDRRLQEAPQQGVCVICFDTPGQEKQDGGRVGLWCRGGGHFVCNSCLEGYVMSQSAGEVPPSQLAARRGRILCPMAAHGCVDVPYAHTEIARGVSEAVFAGYMEAFARAVEAQVVAQVEAAHATAARLTVENRNSNTSTNSQQQPQQPPGAAAAGGARGNGGGEGPTAEQMERLRGHIVEKILTLSCPRCSQAFLDFEGCCALSCARCGCSFCAYCQQDCGTDAHGHVARCPWNIRREVFSRKERFEEAQQLRRKRQVRALLASLPGKTRAMVLDLCKVDLEGLQLDVYDDVAVAGA